MNESKAYVATLPLEVSRDALAKLAAWGERNCWKSAVATQSAHATWIAVREKTRSREECARHAAQILQSIGIKVRTPAREWVRLLRVQEAERLIERMNRRPAATAAVATEPAQDYETKIIDLNHGASHRTRGRATRKVPNIRVTKE